MNKLFNNRSRILVLIAAVGLLAFFIGANVFDFRDRLFGMLFPKPPSSAAACSSSARQFSASLTGAEEVPAVNNTYTATVSLNVNSTDTTQLTYTIAGYHIG